MPREILSARADEHAEAGGVEELDPAQVDHHVSRAAFDQLDEAFPQPGRGVDVDLAADFQHRVVADGVGRQRQFHTTSL